MNFILFKLSIFFCGFVCMRICIRDVCFGHTFVPVPSIQNSASSKTETSGPLAFICSSLQNFNKCRGAYNDLDTVCLRMWSYLTPEDQALTRLSTQVSGHRDAMRGRAAKKQAARAAKRRQHVAAFSLRNFSLDGNP